MIYGIGTDIVSVERIRKVLTRFGERFAERILSDSELAEFASKRDPVRFLAKRFAAKEAFSKALGVGMRMPMAWRRMGVGHDHRGKPIIVCNAELGDFMRARGVGEGHISLTDEHDHAVAFVVLERYQGNTS
jgi:holo-[acyl-carrier protein] synthase